MSFFSKAAKTAKGFFTKDVPRAAQTIFRKGKQFSSTAGDIGDALGFVGRQVRNVANDPVAQGLADLALGSERAGKLQATALRGSQGLRTGGNLLDQASGLTNVQNYRGDARDVAENVLERASKLKKDTQQIYA